MSRGDSIIRPTWEYAYSDDLSGIIEQAKSLGWSENKVQVRRARFRGNYRYFIEPYEDCSCPNVLRYDDYFVAGQRV